MALHRGMTVEDICTAAFWSEHGVRVMDIGGFNCVLSLLHVDTWRAAFFPYTVPRWTVTVSNLCIHFLTAVGLLCPALILVGRIVNIYYTVPLGLIQESVMRY